MPRGRKTVFTPENQQRIIDALEIGATLRDATLSAGISEATFYEWLKRGREATRKNEFSEFLEKVEAAQATCRLNFTAVLAKSANDGDWRAALEYLKRRDRNNWGDYSRQDIANVDVSKLTDEQLARIADGEDILYVVANPNPSAG
jgi:transposase-like protein